MFSKFLKNKSEEISDISEPKETMDDSTIKKQDKKKFSTVDMVFGLGVLMIIGIAFYVVNGFRATSSKDTKHTLDHTQMVESADSSVAPYEEYLQGKKLWDKNKTTNKDEAMAVQYTKPMNDIMREEEPPPFASYEADKNPSWYAKDKQIKQHEEETIKKEKKVFSENVVKEENSHPIVVKIEKNKELDMSLEEETPPKVEHAFVCSLLPSFEELINKEIVYYIRKENNNSVRYLPNYLLSTWDEEGIVIKAKFMGLSVDIKKQMVEVSSNKWIPALKFASCILVEG